jgi:hypothetical protein
MRTTLVFFLLFLFWMQTAMAYEEPKYKIIEEYDDIEIRAYESYIVAEVILAGDFDDVSSDAFSILVGYIGGENIKQQSIEMTTPVQQEEIENSREIEMTRPVEQEPVGDKYRVSFVMPARFTMETLPKPKDKRVILRQVPAKKVVVIRYSGTWSTDNYQEHEAQLMEFINDKGLDVKGKPVWARYDPPFMPWFLRHNEIMIEIAN